VNQKPLERIVGWGVWLLSGLAILNGGFWFISWLNGDAVHWSSAGLLTVKTNMALAQTMAGTALLLHTVKQPLARRLSFILGCAVLIFGGLTLAEHLFEINLGVDQLIASESPGARGTTSPNRMGLPGSASVTLLGLGLLIGVRRRRLMPHFGLAVCFVNLVPLVGFLYRIHEFNRLAGLTAVAWPTVLALMSIGLGMILSEPESGPLAVFKRADAGGRLFRLWLPMITVVPIFLGFLGVSGERRGYFDTEFGTGALVLLLVGMFSVLLWRSAEHLSRASHLQDVAERGKHRLAEQRQLALDAAGLGWWQYDPGTGEARGDERSQAIFAISNSDWSDKAWLSRIHPDDFQRVKAAGQAALQSGRPQPFSLDHRIVLPDHSVRWIQLHATLVIDPEAGLSRGPHFVGTLQDITDRKEVEQVLRESEQRYRLLFDRNPDGVFVVDPTGRFLVVNPASEVISGYTSDELLQKNFIELCAPDQLAKTTKLFQRNVRELSYAQLETAMIRKDGTRVELWIAGEPIVHDKEVVSLHCTARDITERSRILSALKESEVQFRTLADSIPHLAWWADEGGNIVWYNQRWYEYTGTTPEQMRGWGWQSVHDPDMLPQVLERWNDCLASGEAFEMEFPLRGADGRYRWFLTRIMPLRDSTGKVLRWFGTNTDVSETREAREILTRSKQDLERLVSERTAKLQELVGELEHFSYTITHDMRAPLRAMKGFAEVVDELSVDASAEVRQFVRRIMVAAERMDALIRDGLNYSRAVRQELPLEPIDSGALLRGMLDSYPELQPSKAQITVEGELPTVMANEAGLTQCFSNLLGNAVKFVAAGQTPQVKIWAEPRQDWTRIWVADQGIGIPPLMLARIFDMFSRGSNTYEGTGIGLALVRKVVQRMGGKVGVESEEGKGSRFWIELKTWRRSPAAPPSVAA
jgi:PAS domain S-box-containing protein